LPCTSFPHTHWRIALTLPSPIACDCADSRGSTAAPCRWAGGLEDKYFARLAKGAIKVYETPEMTQLDKKDLKLEGVQVRCETKMHHSTSHKQLWAPQCGCCCRVALLGWQDMGN
jgi:hypothetical protein